ncbi:uncharacterized protein N7443_001793 [Penicillium atrosanguineum]|uniref:uncharacterized protein n=1 Tax=Penicillium atrosanguineum TaxID=1132637 RepID=UPI002390D6DF|nr:uncharacterized protein N7443_001793 [Penicillium atrosanguineum]KAJ5117888.1 hypothetical protein N7526_010911 [Penicillium atrosanguineum]KAJ5309332.1 hypothetical protein N7443_001793 [Penicillium atrosanguineum]
MDSTIETPNIKFDVPIEKSQENLLDQSSKEFELPEHTIITSEDQTQHLSAPQVAQKGQYPHSTDPFEALIEELKRLDQDDQQLASQASLLIGLYRRLWEAYTAKHTTNQYLVKTNQQLRTVNVQLGQERELLERRHANQEALLSYFGQAFDKVRDGIAGVLRDWDGSYVDETALPRGVTSAAVLPSPYAGT